MAHTWNFRTWEGETREPDTSSLVYESEASLDYKTILPSKLHRGQRGGSKKNNILLFLNQHFQENKACSIYEMVYGHKLSFLSSKTARFLRIKEIEWLCLEKNYLNSTQAISDGSFQSRISEGKLIVKFLFHIHL